MRLIIVKGEDTTIGASPVPIFAPVDSGMTVVNAIIVEGALPPFEAWQDVSWYLRVDPVRAAICQGPGADLAGAKILVLLE